MRGDDNRTGELFSYIDLEARVRRDHPLRAIRTIVNEALGALECEFAALYLPTGRASISPEKLLRAMLLQAFYSIRSERARKTDNFIQPDNGGANVFVHISTVQRSRLSGHADGQKVSYEIEQDRRTGKSSAGNLKAIEAFFS